MTPCDHKFIGADSCARCGMHIDTLRALVEFELARGLFDDAVALLRDWEDYDPTDPESGWLKRRDEFLAEHEEAGR